MRPRFLGFVTVVALFGFSVESQAQAPEPALPLPGEPAPLPAPSPEPSPEPVLIPQPAPVPQPVPAPLPAPAYAAQPAPTMPTPMAPPPTREQDLFVAAGPAVFIPLGEFENVARPSGGFAVNGGFWLSNSLALLLAFDYVLVNKQEVLSSDLDFSFYGFCLGLHFEPPRQRVVRPFAEGLVGLNTTRLADSGRVGSDSSLLLKLAAGLAVPFSDVLAAGARVNLRHATKSDGNDEITGLGLEAFLQLRF